jgi:trigger factor
MSVAMQVSMKKTGQHERTLFVSIPAEQVDKEVSAKIEKLSKTVKLQGFRAGKIPVNVIKKRFGKDARNEVVGDLVQSTLRDAIRQESVVPANQPKVDIKHNEDGKALEYDAVFEVYPEVELKGLDKLKFDKPKVEISDADIQDTLGKIAKQFREWAPVERAAKDGDRLVLDVKGTLVDEEEPFTDVKEMAVELGAGQMIPGFEDNLTGMQLKEEKSFELPFPEDYFEPKVAGKIARFDIILQKVEEGTLPAIDDALAEKVGIKEGGLDKLKEQMKENLANEAKRIINLELKESLLEHLLKKNKVDVPQSLVDAEIKILEQNPDSIELNKDLSIEENAERRVTLSLLLGQYIKQEGISLDQAKVQQTVRQMAMGYPDPEAVMKWFYQDQQRLSGIASMVLEEQAVEKILDSVPESSKTVSYTELEAKNK